MNKLHRKILDLIVKESKKDPFLSKHNSKYAGHNDKDYLVSNPQLRKIAKIWLERYDGLRFNNFIKLLEQKNRLCQSVTEKYVAGYLIEYSPKMRKDISPEKLNEWLNYLIGWAQVDSLCQSKFDANDLLSNWPEWHNLLVDFRESENINKRRASLVLLTRPIRDVADDRLTDIAFSNIEKLKCEKEILITKAISWLLREMIKRYRPSVECYLKNNEKTLPAIAVRETRSKLKTGRK